MSNTNNKLMMVVYTLFAVMVFALPVACKDDHGQCKVCDKTGDFNGDGVVSILDFSAFQEAFEDQDPVADLNCDGQVDEVDFAIFKRDLAANQ